MKMKEVNDKLGLKLSIQKTKITASSQITSWQIVGETMETVRDFIFFLGGGLQNYCIKRHHLITALKLKLKDACSLEEEL